MGYEETRKLLNKYSQKTRAERLSKESEKQNQRINAMKNKLRVFDGVNSNTFRLKAGQKDRAIFLIKLLPFKKLCGKCSNEQIIIMICFYVKCEFVKDYRLRNCKKILDEYGISEQLLIHFLINLNKLHNLENIRKSCYLH